MASTDKAPYFSVIISTRNRPDLFQTALRSVCDQSFLDKEVLVVIDGSTNSNMLQYRELEKRLDGIRFFELEHRPSGHGQSYSMNFGVSQSSGQYLCFLDDDDHWTDANYLEGLFDSLSASERPVDVHYSNQKAVFSDGRAQRANVWIEDLIPRVNSQLRNQGDSYFVDADFLLTSKGFAHLNCSVFRREFYHSLGGMDESILYENDRDVYIRTVDTAGVILFSTRYVSLHNIPDVSKRSNMSTVSSEIEKKLFQMRVYDKGISLSRNINVVRFCCKAKTYELKHTARILARCNQYSSAAHYANAALIGGFNLRWLVYTLYLIVQALFRPTGVSRDNRQ